MPTEQTPDSPKPENTHPAEPSSPGKVVGPANAPVSTPQPTVIPAQQSSPSLTSANDAPIPGVEVYTSSQSLNNEPVSFNSQSQSKKGLRKSPILIALL